MPCPSMKSARLKDHFAELTDPRRRETIYPLINVVVIAICAVICGADDFVAIARFGRTKREWLGGSPAQIVRSAKLTTATAISVLLVQPGFPSSKP